MPLVSGGMGRTASSSAPLNVLPAQSPTARAWTWKSRSRNGLAGPVTGCSGVVLEGSANVPIPERAKPATSAAVVSAL